MSLSIVLHKIYVAQSKVCYLKGKMKKNVRFFLGFSEKYIFSLVFVHRCVVVINSTLFPSSVMFVYYRSNFWQ